MSFYGDTKRVNSSPFVFDKIYPNRAAMEAAVNTDNDNVYIGRYVLINYTLKSDGTFDNKYETTNGQAGNPIAYTETYVGNLDIDIRAGYGAGFHNTVWQKILTNVSDENNNQIYKYIMIAELNSRSPSIQLRTDQAPMYEDSQGQEHYNEAEINPVLLATAEDSYVYTIPGLLHFELEKLPDNIIGDQKIYVAPQYYNKNNNQYINVVNRNAAFDTVNNDIYWQSLYGDEIAKGTEILGKKLIFSLPALTQVFNDLYDILYGKSQNNGERPFFTSGINFDAVNNTNGLVGLLASLMGMPQYVKATDYEGEYNSNQAYYTRSQTEPYNYTLVPDNERDSNDYNNYYIQIYNALLVSQWQDADEAFAKNQNSFINGLPEVVGSSSEWEASNVNGTKPDYHIDYQNWQLAM